MLFWDRKINMQMMQRSINDSRLNSHSGVAEDSGWGQRDAMSFGAHLLTFWRHYNPSNCQELLAQWHSVIFQKNWTFRWVEYNKRNKHWVMESHFYQDQIYNCKTIQQQHYSHPPITVFLFITFIRPILNSYSFTSAHLYPTYIKALKSSSLFVDPNLNDDVG